MIRPLVKLLENDTCAEVRASAAMSLKNFAVMSQYGKLLTRDGDSIRQALLAVANRPTEDFDVRRRAIEAVASFNTLETNSVVREAYESDNPTLVQSAIFGMGQSSNPAWMPTVVDEMSNPLAAVRFEAATACGLLGEEGVVPHLLRLLRDDDSEVRLASIKSLGMIGGTTAKNALQQHLSDEDEAIEEAAREALIGLEFEDDPLTYQFGG
jgi:HEAT repeat protein